MSSDWVFRNLSQVTTVCVDQTTSASDAVCVYVVPATRSSPYSSAEGVHTEVEKLHRHMSKVEEFLDGLEEWVGMGRVTLAPFTPSKGDVSVSF
jgi:hypothetical protein